MKRLSFPTVILIFCYVSVLAQPCLPEGITFTTQAQIDSFQIIYPNCTEMEGRVWIEGDVITNLSGLSVVTSIGGDFFIMDNPALVSLTGLDNVTFIGGDTWIYLNDALTNLTGLEGLTSIGGYLDIGRNDILINLTGLDKLTSIGGELVIYANDALTNLTGLEGLTSIGGFLYVFTNLDLTSLSGLDSLTSIGGPLWITGNDILTDLSGFENLNSVGGDIEIYENNSLTSLIGLDNLASIGGHLGIWDNDALTSLMGVDNINAASIDDLYIYLNSSLSTCEVESICDYLAIPNASTLINDNAPGCNSLEEVESACETVTVEEINLAESISIYPNPANDILTISYKDGVTIAEIVIYNQTGQKVFEGEPSNNTLDVSRLRQGIYIVELVGREWKVRKKLVVE